MIECDHTLVIVTNRENAMRSIIYLVGLVVVVAFILSFLGIM